jgi:hypothetical protein
MRKSPKMQNPDLNQPSSVSRSSESVEPTRLARTSYSVRFAGKPTRGLRFFRLAVQLFELFDLATSDKQGFEKRAAGRLLAQLYFRSHKLHSKLRAVNAVYDATITELERARARADVLFPKSYAGQVLQDELKTAERYQSKLQLIREIVEEQSYVRLITLTDDAIRRRRERPAEEYAPIRPEDIVQCVPWTWQQMAEQRQIPNEYWETIDLKPLSTNSERDWWKFIWSRLNQRRDELLPQLREIAKQRAEAKTNPIYLKHFYKQFRKHWQTLVRLREVGLF